MKNYFLTILFIIILISCQNQIIDNDDNNNMTHEDYDDNYRNYNNYKNGYKALSCDITNNLVLNDKIYIELEEYPVPYKWYYYISNNNVSYLDENSFDLNSDLDLVGGPVKYIWRFQCNIAGQTVLTFKRQNLDNTNDVIDLKIYNLNIN